MEIASQSQSNEDVVTELTGFFDLLAHFDFEDAKKEHRISDSQEVEKGSSLASGEPFPESCESKQNKQSEEPSFHDKEAKEVC